MPSDHQVLNRRWVCIAALLLPARGWSACVAANDAPSDNYSSMNAAMRSLLPALLDDAARRSGVPQTQLRIVAIESEVWRDGALGCPQPGMLYPQVLVPGYRVRIAAGEGTSKPFDYHLGARGRWLFCAAGQEQPPWPREADPRL